MGHFLKEMLQALVSGGSAGKIPLRSSTSLGVGWVDRERLEPLDLLIWYESEFWVIMNDSRGHTVHWGARPGVRPI